MTNGNSGSRQTFDGENESHLLMPAGDAGGNASGQLIVTNTNGQKSPTLLVRL